VNGTVLYAYDEAGHLLGEYDPTGTLIEETIWLGDIPVATLRPSGATVGIYYVHSDPLNTPREVTRPSDNTAMWTWNSDPFGTDAANPNPAGAGTFAYNLRFPGQVFDGQAGLHQNMARDYDSAVGRYVESDPLGLKAGVNTYAYVGSNPASFDDPTGLAAGTIQCDGKGEYEIILSKEQQSACDVEWAKAHERAHIDDYKKRFGNDSCRNKPRGYVPGFYMDPAFREFVRKSECHAYKVGKVCDQKLLKSSCPNCKSTARYDIRRDNREIEHFCGEP
jgi:RHS repeat-associated protein